MLLLPSRLLLVITLLFLLIHCTKFCKGVVVNINERENVSFFGDVDDDESGLDTNLCCTTGNCTCHSFLHALVNLTDNVMINMTTDVVLSSVVPIVGIENITLFGYDSVTLHCNNSGGLKFTSCNNVTIIGILWEGCGTDSSSPALALYNSSMITVHYCTFQHSIGQALLLSNILKDVKISNCTFIHNNHQRGHGIAIHFLSCNSSQVILMIDGCDFTENGKAESVVYFHGPNYNQNKSIYLHNCVFTNNRGISLHITYHDILITGKIVFQENKGSSIFSHKSTVTFDENSCVNFHDNAATYGGAIYSDQSTITFKGNSNVTCSENTATRAGGAVFSEHSIIIFTDHSIGIFIRNKAYNGGGVYCYTSTVILFKGNSMVTFSENSASIAGGAIYSIYYTNVTFKENSTVKFTNNTALFGAAISSFVFPIISFHENSIVIFAMNNAEQLAGGIHFGTEATVTINGNSSVTFSNNNANAGGGAIVSRGQSLIVFEDNSTVIFIENTGGAMLLWGYQLSTPCLSWASQKIGHNSTSTQPFHDWIKEYYSRLQDYTSACSHAGGGKENYPTVLFKGHTTVAFTNNSGGLHGGAITSSSLSKGNISFEDYCTVRFTENSATNGGAIASDSISLVFTNHSTVAFINNHARGGDGGAIIFSGRNIVDDTRPASVRFDMHCVIIFSENTATSSGGAISFLESSNILFQNNSTVTFTSNKAVRGGAIHSINSSIIFENTIVNFNKNLAKQHGGAIHSTRSSVIITGSLVLKFFKNYAVFGGAIYSDDNCNVVVDGNSTATFISNSATLGGAIYSHHYSNVSFVGFSKGFFINNTVMQDGGAVFSSTSAYILFKGRSTVSFMNNIGAKNGGAIYCIIDSNILFVGNSLSIFGGNKAENGGAIFTLYSNMKVGENSKLSFNDNIVEQNGGALYLSDQFTVTFITALNITFSDNRADEYGGAIYARISQSTITFDNNFQIFLQRNYARLAGNSIFITVPHSCNNSCLNQSIVGINEVTQNNACHKDIATTPTRIELYHPAVCVEYNARKECQIYYVNNIMLGQEIVTDVCVLDYYSQPSNAVQFVITGEDNPDYQISGPDDILLSCGNNSFQGVSIIGNKSVSAGFLNFSVIIKYYIDPFSDEKPFFIKLVVELSPCHPGFWYDRELQKCTCFEDSDVVFCSGINSIIKKGYWFGTVKGQSTVAVCPVNYCDFTCCETTNRFYHLSPLRNSQCRSHRSGTACGSCEDGWTLSFDSAECVKKELCTKHRVLVVILTVIYWIALVILAITMMYYKVQIGYLFALSYYFSTLDILLNEILHSSQTLLISNIIASSFVKVTPNFLGRFCLVANMSGIDQQIIHYIHPLAIVFILIVIRLSAYVSRKLSLYISWGIAYIICWLLLLSYTSVTTSSVLLIRILRFENVDKIYTYLSPDIEYVHGRHLPYTIVAVLCTIVIVIGLPLLLLLEPFLNHKINFSKIQPLLYQFQGCYKAKYHYFAAYYMICRLLIIIILNTNVYNDFFIRYILIISCIAIALVHINVKPYAARFLNTFDGLTLQLMILVAVLPVFNKLNSNLVVGLFLILLILPLMLFLGMILLIYKKRIKKLVMHCFLKGTEANSGNMEISVPMTDIGIIVDDSMRKNATICDM